MILMLIFNVDFSDQGTEVREALQHRSLRMYLIIFSKYFTDWWIWEKQLCDLYKVVYRYNFSLLIVV